MINNLIIFIRESGLRSDNSVSTIRIDRIINVYTKHHLRILFQIHFSHLFLKYINKKININHITKIAKDHQLMIDVIST